MHRKMIHQKQVDIHLQEDQEEKEVLHDELIDKRKEK